MDISVALDAVGGEFNAFTAKEYTCFHARVLDDDLPLAVDVLGDMITDSLIAPTDVEAERDVILDEIAMHDDDPDDVVHNLFAEQAWGDAPLGRPIAGTVESIAALTRDQIARFYRRHYRPANMVVAVAGNVDHADGRPPGAHAPSDATASSPATSRRVAPRPATGSAGSTPARVTARRPLEQVNLVLGVNGLTRNDDRRFALGVLNTALGGGTSSRLFQEVRERRGLAYSVFSFASHYADAGLVGRLGRLPARQARRRAGGRARGARARWPTTASPRRSCARGKGQLRGGLVLGLEDSGSRMSRIGKAELVYDELLAHRRGDGPGRRRHPSTTSAPSRPSCSRSPRSWPSSARPERLSHLHDAGAGDRPEHAGEGADDEALGGARAAPSSAAQLRVAAQALERRARPQVPRASRRRG